MTNVFDYLRWRGDIPFTADPLNEIDALIFCEISYIFFDSIVPADSGEITLKTAADLFFEKNKDVKVIKLGEIVPDEIVDLLRLAAESERFSSVVLSDFVNIIDDDAVEQFCALCFRTPADSLFVAYRGTDDSITGWRENFRMAFKAPVPAQLRASEYLESISAEYATDLYIGGHSKGGNLALWAALNATEDIRARIRIVYNFDGPGFLQNIWEDSAYSELADRIVSIVPSGAIVGMLLKYDKNYRVARSSAKKHLYQHDALTWEVSGKHFVCDEDIEPDVKRINRLIDNWANSMEPQVREAFVEAFFDTLISTNAKTLTELSENRAAILRAFSNADAETKQALNTGFKLLVDEGKTALSDQIRSVFKKKEEGEPLPEKEPKPQKSARKHQNRKTTAPLLPRCQNCKHRRVCKKKRM